MSKPGLSFGLNLGKKTGPAKSRPPPRKAAFGGGDDSDDEAQNASKNEETITELDGFAPATTSTADDAASSKHKKGRIPQEPPKLKSKVDSSRQFGDLSSALTSKKYAEAAEALDPSVYDYDAAHDVIQAAKKQREAEIKKETAQRKSRYMSDVTKAAEQRERDRSIAELKKIQREREAEGDEFADKEKFVTEAYKRKQEEDRIAQEEEKRREEEERKKNKFGGMTGFHKELLEREDQLRADMEKMVSKSAVPGGIPKVEDEGNEEDRTEKDVAREINEKGGAVMVNEDGEVVDKRQLLQGGLNLGAKKKTEAPKDQGRSSSDSRSRDHSKGHFASGGKQAMRDRQTRMLEAQLEESLKRAREEEEEERKKVEQETKSRKTNADISSAKERYLARKRAAEEAKKNGQQDGP
ncbi:coiled-coil domain-containing protein 55 [Diaporthe amygdali]|uniref:coiled-coil domain-containing protein 55 n=1 Tax=Phomopsis amygdali TaxID=1214568 RepID=UPI0022FDB301|nr:coiled-coil domain-containing protein 55 [Diaporthe amygdali]KAJ0109267.1 coiled-coil domain-containing protein 55 [Diaporthe amygdali]